eukprot:69549_1
MEQEEESKSLHSNAHPDVTETLNTNEEKYGSDALLSSEYIPPRTDDYNCNGDITKCIAMQRVVHLLTFYKDMAKDSSNNEDYVFEIYAYIESLQDFGVSKIMEDWYHCHTYHFKIKRDISLVKDDERINCNNNKKCSYFVRNQRQRSQQTFNVNKNVDHKNIILMDQLDSMHTYIFHSPSLTNMLDIWSTKPKSIEQCNVQQIVCILKVDILNTFKKLEQYQSRIIEYIQKQKLNGSKLMQINRKQFSSQMAKYFNNKKLRGAFGQLYTTIKDYNLQAFVSDEDIWSNKPESVAHCNSKQIMYILDQNEVFENLDKLSKYKMSITNYIQKNDFDGQKLSKTNRKTFANQIVKHLDNKKLKANLAKLYNNIMNFDLSKFIDDATNNPNKDSNMIIHTKPESNKYVTDNLGYYAFGKQYLYTANLSSHRLYVSADYDFIKDELLEYYKFTHQGDDETMLLHTQLQTLQTTRHHLQLVLEKFITGCDEKDDSLFDLWCRPDDLTEIEQFIQSNEFLLKKSGKHSKDKTTNKDLYGVKIELSPLIPLLVVNYQHLFEAICPLFDSLSKEYIFIEFLRYYVVMINELIQQNLSRYYFDKEFLKEVHFNEKGLELLYKTIFAGESDYYNHHIVPYLMVNRGNIFQSIKDRENLGMRFDEMKDEKIKDQDNMKKIFYEMMVIDHEQMSTVFASDNKMHNLMLIMSFEMYQSRQQASDTIENRDQTENIKQKFISIASNIISSLVANNRSRYLEYQNMQRYLPFIEKAKMKFNMNSIKQMKAIWYHGLNEDHQIRVGAPLSQQHILALLCYTDDTKLCYEFRK